MKVLQKNWYGLISLLLALPVLTGCSPPADNYLRLTEIYQAQGRTAAAYNALKKYLRLNPSARMEDELLDLFRDISLPASGPQSDLDWVREFPNQDDFLKSYLHQTIQKMNEYEKEYSHLKMTWDEEGPDIQDSGVFPITVVLDGEVLSVAFITTDEYLLLLEDVSIMYKDHLYYQNPYLLYGIMLGMKGRYKEAVRQFREAIGLDPGNAKAYNNLGITFFKMAKFEASRDSFLKALELNPDNIFAHNNLGLTYLKLHKSEKAEEQFKLTLSQEPFNLPAHIFLGFLFYKDDKLSQAERYYQGANDINPSLPQVNYALGRVMIGKGRWDWSIDYFQKTLALDKTFLKAYVSLGGVYTHKERYQAAEDMLHKAIELEPAYALAYYNLACACALQNKQQEAIHNLKKALANGFSNRNLLLTDTELDNVRDEPGFVELMRKSK